MVCVECDMCDVCNVCDDYENEYGVYDDCLFM